MIRDSKKKEFTKKSIINKKCNQIHKTIRNIHKKSNKDSKYTIKQHMYSL